MPYYGGPPQEEIDASEPAQEPRSGTDYGVRASWVDDEGNSHEEHIGYVYLAEDSSFQEMPTELEINGFTYKLEV